MTVAAETGDLEARFAVIHELVGTAYEKLSPPLWNYILGGGDTEVSLKRNRLAIESLALRPRVLCDVSAVDSTAKLLGKPSRLPLMLAPVGSIDSYGPGGQAAAARAAARFGIPAMFSSVPVGGLERMAEAAPHGRRIYQLYVRGDEAWVDDFGRRAIAQGYEAFCFTVDSAVYSRRERDLAHRFNHSTRRTVNDANEHFQAAFTWEKLARFKDRHKIPLILKGIATAADAARACEIGVDVIYVSNHGGRQLDHCEGSIAVLPEIVAAVKGRAPVLVDGGFCRGTDIVKALLLGAHAVGIGKLYCWALAAAGEAGIVRLLELLEIEIRMTLGLLGAASYGALTPDMIAPAPAVTPPHGLSAFPHLQLAPRS